MPEQPPPIHTCPECGAALEAGDTCQSIFEALLPLEFTHPVFGSVHMLTVACYMIQHNRYSDAGLVWIERRLRDHLESGLSQQEIRARVAGETGQDVRGWKVARQPGERPLPPVRWSVTIADVAYGFTDAEDYARRVRRWAQAVLDEMRPLLP